ncbi:MAG: hypothetical protein M3355_00640 [Actinomycetota bacterium]|nr:hypothetical protein [Actinomycetota bacterium]
MSGIRRLQSVLIAFLAAASVLTASCGSDDPAEGQAGSTSAPTSAEETAAAEANPLVGEWSTENVCEDQLRAFEQAGLDHLVSEWVEDYPGQKPTDSDPCQGTKPIEHSHRFGESGSFASYDANGQQVDDGSYTPVDDRTFTLGNPPVNVHYRIEGDKATFDVVIPDCKTNGCEESTAYVTSVFFPRTYDRVR